MTTHPSHTAMLEGRLLTMRQEVRRAVGEVRAALAELDKIDAELSRSLIGVRAIEGDMQAQARRRTDPEVSIPMSDEAKAIMEARA
jgi:hypothetical protein